MSKATYLADLYKQSVSKLTTNSDSYKSLLTSMSRFYKRSFDNAVLIHVQNPNATQLATFDEWHAESINRSINKGAKGIAVIDMSNPQASFKHYFDLLDTNGSHESFKQVVSCMWELENQYKPSLMIKFKEKYGVSTESIEKATYEVIEQRVEEHLSQTINGFEIRNKDSKLYNMPIMAVRQEMKEIITNSIYYTVASRSDLDVNFMPSNAFENINKYDDLNLFMFLGSATMSIARPLLKEINQDLNKIKAERSKLYENTTISELNLQRGERWNDVSQLEDGERTTDRASGQIRDDVERVHDGEQSTEVDGTRDDGRNQSVHSESGRGNGNASREVSDGATRSSTTSTERTDTRESFTSGNDLQDIRGNDSSRETISNLINNAEPFVDSSNNLSADGFFVIPKVPAKEEPTRDTSFDLDEEEISDLIDVFLIASDVENDTNEWQAEIGKFMLNNESFDDCANVIKSFYENLDTSYTTQFGDYLEVVKSEENGIYFERGGQPFTVTYEEMAERIGHLINLGEYPYKEPEEALDEYAIPDEVYEQEHEEETQTFEDITNEEIIEAFVSNDTFGNDFHDLQRDMFNYIMDYPYEPQYAVDASINQLRNSEFTFNIRGLDVKAIGSVTGIKFYADDRQFQVAHEKITETVRKFMINEISPFTDEDFNRGNSNFVEKTLKLHPYTKILDNENVSNIEYEEPEEVSQLEINFNDFDDEENDGFLEFGEPAPEQLEVGTRVFHDDKVYEILSYLHDGKTVEIGNIEQLKNLDTFKITTRVPLSFLNDCDVVQENYTDGELANLVVNSVSGDEISEEKQREIKAASIINNTHKEFNTNLTNDFMDRLHTDTLNYKFDESHGLYDGGAKTKCKANIEAIKLLKQLEKVGQHATQEQQIILAGYVGWGGLANALTPNKAGWENEYAEIKSLLTEEEFQSAQESTTTAYFTAQSIIKNIYKALDKFGFKTGNILDPAMGTGNFYSVLPDEMKQSNLYGVELDSITGRIAQRLYPKASIEVKGFEETNYPDQFFDVAIGNIPFNNIQISDKRYDKHNFKIHDYFIAKSLDKVRAGGLMAFITSKGTLDKANPSVRQYIANKAELVGAIRLPNTAFKQVAGTEVTSDILFFKKREYDIVASNDNCNWLSVENNDDGIPMNSYFIEHPKMILGEMVFDKSMYGDDKATACHPLPNDNLEERLDQAIHYLECDYQEPVTEFVEEKENTKEWLPAMAGVKNFSYAIAFNEIYYRENSRMYKQDITGKKADRIKGMIQIHNDVDELIKYQNDDFIRATTPVEEFNDGIKLMIATLNIHYDSFVKEFGYLNSPTNISAFKRDGAIPLLRSIETQSKTDKKVFEKTAIFERPTIHKREEQQSVDNADDALLACINSKGKVDLRYMAHIYLKEDGENATPNEIIEELGNKIFQDPDLARGEEYDGYVMADEYLSGYVKDKLKTAKFEAMQNPEKYARNVEALEAVQPQLIEPHEIKFELGSTWIPSKVYQEFIYDLCETYQYNRGYNGIELEFAKFTGSYHIARKSNESTSVAVNQTYGTRRKNAYEIIEDTLNLKKVEVRDPVEYMDGSGEKKKKYVVNQKETILAREKQGAIEHKFKGWLFADPERSEKMTKLYNDLMNNIVNREYDGSHLTFPNMNDSIKLTGHQKEAVAQGLYSNGNLLMAHEVGAGKTFAAIALTNELKRIGAVQKPLITVPNHLVSQWATEYMKLYPNANILVAEKRDFEKNNRRRFASKIAVGDYDAIIMAHSSFELIGLSKDYQLEMIDKEISEVTKAIQEMKYSRNENWSLKQMQIFKKNLETRHNKLFNAEKKDTVVTFEQLGVDCLVVDESHAYKNNYSYTKLRNVAGVGSNSSQRAMDMHMKAQYINKMNDGKGVIYLTGTPISNSMSEMYVLQKTLQPQELEKRGQSLFDSWASAYGVITSSLEIKPEGNGYQMKNRFSEFHNIPELMKMFRMVANIKTADMLEGVPRPRLKNDKFSVVKTKITPYQKDIVMELAERAERIRSGAVGSSEDNFLKLTMEARLLATDPRAVDPDLPNDPDYKLNVCARQVAEIYHDTAEKKLTQIIFCDQGTPKDDGSFNFYQATKDELINQGVAPHEIAFIHDANTDLQKKELYDKVKIGEIRVLMGSTGKMGTGMNVRATRLQVKSLHTKSKI